MTRSGSQLFASLSQWSALAVCLALGAALFLFVDLSPEIEADFFFSRNDPQAQKSASIEKEFGAAPQIFVAVRSRDLVSRQYLSRLQELTQDLEDVKGVADARSITQGPIESEKMSKLDPASILKEVNNSPFWSRLLLAPDRSASFVVLRLSGKDYRATVNGIDRVLARHARSGFELGASGVAYVAEHIRRQLTRDLQRFSIAAFIAFAILTVLLFRSVAVLVGTMVASLSAAFATFIARALVGMRTDILAPNLWTIAFVLTLSHVAYIAAQWRRNQMIHLGYTVRRLRGKANDIWTAWKQALKELWAPILASMLIVTSGFALFLLSSFPPTRRLGILVCIGAAITDLIVLVVLPAIVTLAHRLNPVTWRKRDATG
jgi:predicted RND superfamily exporter protein